MLGEFSSQTARTETTTALPATSNFLDGYNGLSSFIFAFSGHSMFLEIMSEMEVPKDFTKSLKHANGFMCVLYFVSSSWSYMFLGDAATGFMPDMLKNEVLKKIVGLLLAYHIIVSYVQNVSCITLLLIYSNITNTSLEHQRRYLLTNQPLVCQILRIMGYEKTATSTVDRKVWATIQISLLLFSYLIANIVPFFSSLQGIIGSALAAPIMFGWPPVFFLCCVRMKNHKLARSDMILCR